MWLVGIMILWVLFFFLFFVVFLLARTNKKDMAF
jgi:hypothetical protein